MSFSETSMPTAVAPVSEIATPSTPFTRSRISLTVSSVVASVGPVSGMTARRAVVPASFICGAATASTPSVPPMIVAVSSAAEAVAFALSPATTATSLPLKPSPKPSVVRS